MKPVKSFIYPTLLIVLIIIISINFLGCKPDDIDEEEGFCDNCVTVYKPNIYIYPREKIQLFVTLDSTIYRC